MHIPEASKATSLREIAENEKIDNGCISRRVNLMLLAPYIEAAILDDQLPEGISLFDMAVDVAARKASISSERERWVSFMVAFIPQS